MNSLENSTFPRFDFRKKSERSKASTTASELPTTLSFSTRNKVAIKSQRSYGSDIKNRDSKKMIIFTMDSISTYEAESKRGGPAGISNCIVIYCTVIDYFYHRRNHY